MSEKKEKFLWVVPALRDGQYKGGLKMQKYNDEKRVKAKDIATIHSRSIENIYAEFFAKLVEGSLSIEQKLNYVTKLTQLYRLENISLKLSFEDKRGREYMNSIFHYITEDGIIEEAFFLLNGTKRHYMGCPVGEFETNLSSLPEREIAIISGLFTLSGSREMLIENEYGYSPREKRKFHRVEDQHYCEAVLGLLKEITIRTYNYVKYEPGTDKEVLKIYEDVASSYDEHLEEANKSPVRRVFECLQYDWKKRR